MKRLLIYLYELLLPKKRDKTLVEKIDYLLKVKLEPYNMKFITNRNYFLEKNINTYRGVIEHLLTLDYINTKVTIRPIVEGTHPYMTYGLWFSPNNEILDTTPNDIYLWLKTVRKYVILYESIYKDYNNHIAMINSIKIKPYIINIESIVEDMLRYRL